MKSKFSMVMALLLSFTVSNTIAQSKPITIGGKVTSFEESIALEGVSISVKGTKNYTGTQADGTFNLDVLPENKTLVFELKDYETQEVKITGKKDYEIVLKRSSGSAQTNIQKQDGNSLSATSSVGYHILTPSSGVLKSN